MMDAGRWRWPLTAGLPVLLGAAMIFFGPSRLHYTARTMLGFSGTAAEMSNDLSFFQSGAIQKRLAALYPALGVKLDYARVPGHPTVVSLSGEGTWPKPVVKSLEAAGLMSMDQAFARKKSDVHQQVEALEALKTEAELRWGVAVQQREAYLAEHPHRAFRGGVPAKRAALDQAMNEAQLRLDQRASLLTAALLKEKNLKSAWQVLEAAVPPAYPIAVEHFPLLLSVIAVLFGAGCFFIRGEDPVHKNASNGLWKPDEFEKAMASAPALPVELTVVPAERAEAPRPEVAMKEPVFPSDPLTVKAAELYTKWVEVVKVLYAPSAEAPQGIIESVGPLMQECIAYLPQGHDVLTRYLAQTVAPGNLPAHVARTVLMTLTGAQDAGVSEEHRLAMALAALFHDLAVVPRLESVGDDVGSEVGRLSASVLRRIPGLDPLMLSMVEDILIGMDEFKLETWQNAATGKSLEPLSKVLREIDRFEKVMQKQKMRLDRQVLERKAAHQ